MAETRKKPSTSRRAPSRPARPSASEVQLLSRSYDLARDENVRLRNGQRRDSGLLMVAVVYLACALVLTAYVYGRKAAR